jgi:predicted metal-dependent hydrolase
MHQIHVNGLAVEIVRKNIKNAHLAVYPPNGRIRVAVPSLVDDEAVRLLVITRLGWIKRQQAKFLSQPRQTEREYVSGESHYFLGNRYLLNVIYADGTPKVAIRNKTTLDLTVRPNSDCETRERVLLAWYRRELKAIVPDIVAKWEAIIGVQITEWGIKQMKTKWGTCNISARRIWLNLELVKKPVHCVEYVIVHELVHLLERHHNDRFTGFMDKFLPNWRFLRDELNAQPLAHEDWEY